MEGVRQIETLIGALLRSMEAERGFVCSGIGIDRYERNGNVGYSVEVMGVSNERCLQELPVFQDGEGEGGVQEGQGEGVGA